MKTSSAGPGFRYVNQMVGVFVLSTVLVFVLAALGSGRVQKWLNPGARIKIILPEYGLFGLSEKANVEILGTHAGRVIEIVIDPKQNIHAEVEIQNNMKTFVRQDSRVFIRKTFGVAGASYLEITRGFGAPLDWEYAVLKAEVDRVPTETVGELISEVRDKLFPVIDDTQAAIRTFQTMARDLRDPDGDLQQMLVGLNAVTSKIVRGEGTVGRLVTGEDLADDLQAAVANAEQVSQRLVPIIDNLSGLSDKINAQVQDLPEMSQNIREILESVNILLKDLARATPELPGITHDLGEAATDIPMLLIQTQQVMVELDRLLRQLQSHWLFGGGAKTDDAPSARISPLEVNP